MSSEEMKTRIHEDVENMNDNEFLLAIKELIKRKYNSINNSQLNRFQFNRMNE